MKKRLVALFVVFALVFSMVPTAFAAEGDTFSLSFELYNTTNVVDETANTPIGKWGAPVTSVRTGDIVVLAVKLNNTAAIAEYGIRTLAADITYDATILKPLDTLDEVTGVGFTDTGYDYSEFEDAKSMVLTKDKQSARYAIDGSDKYVSDTGTKRMSYFSLQMTNKPTADTVFDAANEYVALIRYEAIAAGECAFEMIDNDKDTLNVYTSAEYSNATTDSLGAAATEGRMLALPTATLTVQDPPSPPIGQEEGENKTSVAIAAKAGTDNGSKTVTVTNPTEGAIYKIYAPEAEVVTYADTETDKVLLGASEAVTAEQAAAQTMTFDLDRPADGADKHDEKVATLNLGGDYVATQTFSGAYSESDGITATAPARENKLVSATTTISATTLVGGELPDDLPTTATGKLTYNAETGSEADADVTTTVNVSGWTLQAGSDTQTAGDKTLEATIEAIENVTIPANMKATATMAVKKYTIASVTAPDDVWGPIADFTDTAAAQALADTVTTVDVTLNDNGGTETMSVTWTLADGQTPAPGTAQTLIYNGTLTDSAKVTAENAPSVSLNVVFSNTTPAPVIKEEYVVKQFKSTTGQLDDGSNVRIYQLGNKKIENGDVISLYDAETGGTALQTFNSVVTEGEDSYIVVSLENMDDKPYFLSATRGTLDESTRSEVPQLSYMIDEVDVRNNNKDDSATNSYIILKGLTNGIAKKSITENTKIYLYGDSTSGGKSVPDSAPPTLLEGTITNPVSYTQVTEGTYDDGIQIELPKGAFGDDGIDFWIGVVEGESYLESTKARVPAKAAGSKIDDITSPEPPFPDDIQDEIDNGTAQLVPEEIVVMAGTQKAYMDTVLDSSKKIPVAFTPAIDGKTVALLGVTWGTEALTYPLVEGEYEVTGTLNAADLTANSLFLDPNANMKVKVKVVKAPVITLATGNATDADVQNFGMGAENDLGVTKSDIFVYSGYKFRDSGFTVTDSAGVADTDLSHVERYYRVKGTEDWTKIDSAYSTEEALEFAAMEMTEYSKIYELKYVYADPAYTGSNVKAEITRQVIVTYKRGDVNRDGNVNAGDAGDINSHAKAIVPITATDPIYLAKAVDVNADGNINAGDAGDINSHAKAIVPIVQYYSFDADTNTMTFAQS